MGLKTHTHTSNWSGAVWRLSSDLFSWRFFHLDSVSELTFLCSFFLFFLFHGSHQTFVILHLISFIPKVWFDAQDGLHFSRLALCSGRGLRAAVLAPGFRCFSSPCCFAHITSMAPAEADAAAHPTECISHSDPGCFLLWSLFPLTAVAKALSSLKQAHKKLPFWSCVHRFLQGTNVCQAPRYS